MATDPIVTDEQVAERVALRALQLRVAAMARDAALAALPGMRKKARRDLEARKAVAAVTRTLKKQPKPGPGTVGTLRPQD